MIWLWLSLAFLVGYLFAWKLAGRLIYHALKRSLVFETASSRMEYTTLIRLSGQVEKELAQRRPPESA